MFVHDLNTGLRISQTGRDNRTIRWFEVPVNDLARMDECKTVRNIIHDVEDHGEFEVGGYMYSG